MPDPSEILGTCKPGEIPGCVLSPEYLDDTLARVRRSPAAVLASLTLGSAQMTYAYAAGAAPVLPLP